MGGTVWLARRERRLGHAGRGFWTDTAIVALIVLGALLAHLGEIALWAVIFVLSGEFVDFGTAYYHSAVNFTTLDIILSPRWRLLGLWKPPLECSCLLSQRLWSLRLSNDWPRRGLPMLRD